MPRYELRHDANPQAMPGGSGVISRHRRIDTAKAAYERLARRRISARDRAAGAWLPAVIIDTDTGQRIDPRGETYDD